MALIALIGCNRAAEPEERPRPTPASPDAPTQDAALPPDVVKFVERLEGCRHFSGEPPFDAKCAAFLNRNIQELCPGNDATLAAMQRKCADNPVVIESLAEFAEDYE